MNDDPAGSVDTSQELDRLIAEKVMGWRVHHRNTAWWVDAANEFGLVREGGVRGKTSSFDRWSPSTSIAAAWQVVEKMRAAWSCHINDDEPLWEVS